MVIGHEVIGGGPNKVVVLPDYRGYGASKALSGAHTIREIATDAIALADHLDWERFSVVGHSMRGMAAQRVAVDAPGHVESLACITPVPASGVPTPPEVAPWLVTLIEGTSPSSWRQSARARTPQRSARRSPEAPRHRPHRQP